MKVLGITLSLCAVAFGGIMPVNLPASESLPSIPSSNSSIPTNLPSNLTGLPIPSNGNLPSSMNLPALPANASNLPMPAPANISNLPGLLSRKTRAVAVNKTLPVLAVAANETQPGSGVVGNNAPIQVTHQRLTDAEIQQQGKLQAKDGQFIVRADY